MRSKVFFISALAVFGVAFGLATGIGVAATDSSHPASTSKAATATTHSGKDMRAHVQAMHSSLSKTQIDQLVADCQKNRGSMMMDGADMMASTNMTGGHASHHSSKHSSGMSGGMMSGQMMG